MNKIVSVIVPVYNADQYLEACVLSILTQSYAELDIILINDGSSDKSAELCDNLATNNERVRVAHTKNGGVSHARNIGISMAKGVFVTFIDADDIVDKNMIEILYSSLIKDECDISTSNITPFSTIEPSNIKQKQNKVMIMDSDDAIKEMLYEKKIINGPVAKIYRKSLFEQKKVFPKGITIGEDLYVNYYTFLKARKVAVNSASMYYYRQRDGSVTHSSFTSKRMDGLWVIKNILNDAQQHHPRLVQAAKNRLFMEAVYISIALASENLDYKAEQSECINLMKTYSKTVLYSIQSRVKFKLFALLAMVNTTLFISLFKFKRTLRQTLRRQKDA